MIGIIGAKTEEIAPVLAETENITRKKIGVTEFISGVFMGREIVTAVSGVGKVAAAMCAQSMILEYSPECIINTGVAGSLSTELGIGDIAVAESFVQHDMDTTAVGDPPGLLSGLNIINIPCDERISQLLADAAAAIDGIKAVRGIIASGDKFVADEPTKEYIKKTFNAAVCEMEGGAIAQVCYANGVPFGAVRSCSDCADGSSHMDYWDFLPIAAANAARIIRCFAETV